MAPKCPSCGHDLPDGSVYCLYCGRGIRPSARTTTVSAAGTLLIVAAVASLVFFMQSVQALAQIYGWYPSSVAEEWIVYDQGLAGFTLTGFVFGLAAGILSLARKSYRWTMSSAAACAFSGAGAWIISMIIPYANLRYSFLYYFLPVFLTALISVVLIFPRRAEFST
jgi:hypothetical protein